MTISYACQAHRAGVCASPSTHRPAVVCAHLAQNKKKPNESKRDIETKIKVKEILKLK